MSQISNEGNKKKKRIIACYGEELKRRKIACSSSCSIPVAELHEIINQIANKLRLNCRYVKRVIKEYMRAGCQQAKNENNTDKHAVAGPRKRKRKKPKRYKVDRRDTRFYFNH